MTIRPLRWVGRSLDDLLAFPAAVRREVGYALYVAQEGGRHPSAKPLKGFGGAGVVEIVEDHVGGTFRAVYTVRFAEAIYVLHAFQKKPMRGSVTPQREMDLIRLRLRLVEQARSKGSR
jgi:phage-related protein